jgi:hypothetical protein
VSFKAPKGSGANEPRAIHQLNLQSSAYGIARPLLYGLNRLAGNILWVDNFQAHENRQSSGSKQGGRVVSVSFTYTASVIIGLCEGPAYSLGTASVGRSPAAPPREYEPGVWKVKKALFPIPGIGEPHAGFWPFLGRAVANPPSAWPGTYQTLTEWPIVQGIVQAASPGSPVAIDLGAGDGSTIYWSYLWQKFGPGHGDEHLAYPQLCYAAGKNVPLDSNASLPNFNWPAIGLFPYFQTNGLALNHEAIADADPAWIAYDMLTSAAHGCGLATTVLADLFTGTNSFSAYCRAAEILLSPLYDTQRPASQVLEELAHVCNTAIVWSEGVLKLIPYGDLATTSTRTGVSFDPQLSLSDPSYNPAGAQLLTRYALGDTDFIRLQDEDPVIITRKPIVDVYTTLSLEFLDRDNAYAPSVAEASDSAGVASGGAARPAPQEQAHMICSSDLARATAQRLLQRLLSQRNTYTFRLGWEYVLLEPMDVVRLTDTACGLNALPVRITTVSEDASGNLEIEAEDLPIGVHSAAAYGVPTAVGTAIDYNVAPGPMHPPSIFEAPLTMTDGVFALSLTVSGGPFWGGATIWLSEDGATYRQVATVDRRATHGFLATDLAAVANPDTTSTATLALWEAGTLGSQTIAEARALQGVLAIDDGADVELVAPTTLTFLGTADGLSLYSMSGFKVRGAYQTLIAAHAASARVALLDGASVLIPLDVRFLGATIYLKVLPFNLYGAGTPDLSTIEPITWTVTGQPLIGNLPALTGVHETFRDGHAVLTWDAMSDVRSPDVEVRVGADWNSARVLGRTDTLAFQIQAPGTYWLASHVDVKTGLGTLHGYGPAMSLVVAGATLVANVVATSDEAASTWPGTVGAYPDAVLNDGPTLYYRRSGGAFGSIALPGEALTESGGGVSVGTSLLVNDTNAAISLSGSSSWVRITGQFSGSALLFAGHEAVELLFKRSHTTASDEVLWQVGPGTGVHPKLVLEGTTGKLKCYDNTTLLATTSVGVTDTTTAHHVVWCPYAAKLYLDGVDVTPGGLTAPSAGAWTALTIGADSTGAANFAGTVDEIAVYPVALTAAQVAAHYAAATIGTGRCTIDGSNHLVLSSGVQGRYYGAVAVGPPSEHPAKLSARADSVFASAYATVHDVPDMSQLAIVGGDASGVAGVTIEYATAHETGTPTAWSAWQPLVPGRLVGELYRVRLTLTRQDTSVAVTVTDLVTTLDVDDLDQEGTNVAAGPGALTTVTFPQPFLTTTPNVQVTIADAQPGDTAIIANVTATTFDVGVKNGGSYVARHINYLAQGY